MPTAFIIGIKYGLFGLSLAWLFGFPVVFFSNIVRALHALDLELLCLLRVMAPSALSSAAMYGAVAFARTLYPTDGRAYELVILIAVGVSIYTVLAVVFNKQEIRELKGLLKA
jgi:hypothetical protein